MSQALQDAAENLLSAYRARYGGLARGGVRRDAPLQREMGELAAALNAIRATATGGGDAA